MRVIVCPDSFKDCLSAAAVAAALAQGVRRACPDAEIVELPVADGGEGTVDALVAATGGSARRTTVTGPLGEPVEAAWGVLGDGRTAVLEMAAASGLELVPVGQRDPRVTTTHGTGELVRAALDEGVRKLIIGIGGSATNDGGTGLAAALGARLLDAAGHPLAPGGAALAELDRIDPEGLDPRLTAVEIRVACDVDNPLCGPRGASHVYGPQKGASPQVVEQLDAALAHYAEVLERDLGQAVAELPGAGAAGGLGAGLVAFCGASLEPGIEIVLEAVGFDQQLPGTDLLLTGEGRLDPSTLSGKTIHGILRHAVPTGVPVVAIGGAVSGDPAAFLAAGLTAALALPNRPMTLDEALAEAPELLAQAAETVVRLVRLGTLG